MGRSSVRVIARTRPTDSFYSGINVLEDGKTFHLRTSKKGENEVINNTNDDHMFKVDAILRDASQEAVFDLAASDLVKSTMAGYNGTLLCYGQTGAGKTFTLMGGTEYRTRGCLPRCIKAVFDEAQMQADKTFNISVSFIEIYNDHIRDLLNPTSEDDFAVQEDAKGNVTVRGVEQRPCQRESDALALLFEGNTNRQTAEHSLNANSSRSHVIFTIHVVSRSRVESESASIISKLHCIDLAGSERLSKTGSDGKTAKEAQYINKSLTFLEQVVMALGNASRSHVPFRQSKLTNLLKDSLGGNSRTTMIANIWPEERNMEETTSTLKFAVRMMRVQTDPTINAVMDPATQIKQLQRTITELKAELQMQNQLVGKSHVQYEGDFGEDERFEMEKMAKQYVGGGIPMISVKSLREVKEYFKILKGMIDQRDAELRSGGGGAAASLLGTAAGNRTGTAPNAAPNAPGVGIIDKSSGFSVGVAAPSKALKEVLKAQPAPPGVRGELTAQNFSVERTAGPRTELDGGVADRSNVSNIGELPDKNTAFADFKKGPGAKISKLIKDTQEDLIAKRKRITDLGQQINQLKGQIDATSAELSRMRNERIARGDDDVVDDNEFALVGTMKDTKLQYRKLYDELSQLKDERDVSTRSVDAAKRRLVEDFDQWYNQQFEAAGGYPSSQNASPLKSSRYAQLDDDLDEGERFEALELNKVLDDDPDSVAFYTAKKMATSKQQGSRAGPFQRRKL